MKQSNKSTHNRPFSTVTLPNSLSEIKKTLTNLINETLNVNSYRNEFKSKEHLITDNISKVIPVNPKPTLETPTPVKEIIPKTLDTSPTLTISSSISHDIEPIELKSITKELLDDYTLEKKEVVKVNELQVKL